MPASEPEPRRRRSAGADVPLVWVPFEARHLAERPDVRVETVDPTAAVPDSCADVRVYVAPYRMDSSIADVIPRLPQLEMIQLLTAGFDHMRGRVPDGVQLCSGRGIHDASTAELALTLTLASLRGVPEYVRAADRRSWDFGWRPALADKHVLIVGYGAVGRAVESRLAPFEVTVTRVARRARDGVHAVEDLPQLVRAADVVIVVLPLSSETRGLFSARMLGLLKDGALLVNLARGPVVDTDALVNELATGRITAALDVVDPEPLPPDHPLWSAQGLLLTPHVGGASSAMWPRAHRLVADQISRYAIGHDLVNVVDAGPPIERRTS